HGEANVMEKASADLQRSQIKIQLKELRTVYDITLLKFQLLLNATEPYQPEGEIISEINSEQLLADNNLNHPELQLLKQQVSSYEAAVKLEKAKFLPNLIIGYYTQTMQDINKGMFNSVQLGIGIPIFTKAQKA